MHRGRQAKRARRYVCIMMEGETVYVLKSKLKTGLCAFKGTPMKPGGTIQFHKWNKLT